MIIKGITDEDFINYKKPSMFIATSRCSWKCLDKDGKCVCQNLPLAKQPSLNVPDEYIVQRYIDNPITKAVVIGGLEPLDQLDELSELIWHFREKTDDDIVIYTGYERGLVSEDEIRCLKEIARHRNLIMKFGRYIPDSQPRYDDVLGIWLASENQYAERLC